MNSSDISGRPYDKLADAEKKKLFRNASYWAKRLEELAENQNLKGDEYVKTSEKLYRKAQKSIEDKINAWYGRFAKNNDISFSEAQKRLKTDELEEFKWTVEEYIEKARQSADGSYLKELENASARVHVNRLEFMNTQLEVAARLLYNSTESGLKGLLSDIYEDTYYRSIFEIQKGYGVGASFSRLDTKLIDKVLSQPWAQDGSNFSSRVWSNKEELVRKLKTDFSQSLIRGESRDKIISRLSKDLEQDRKKTARLVHTETAALQNKAALDAYKELGVDKVRILGTLDSVTCSLCGSMDGMILPRTQLEQGVTEPPFHPNCRCTTVPYDEDWDYKGQRIAKDKDGKYYYVPETMSYEEWKREFAQGKKSGKVGDVLGETKITDKFNIDVSDEKAVQKLIDKTANDISYEKLEHATVITADGTVYKMVGGETNVNTDLIGESLEGATVIHNHPPLNGVDFYDSFSRQDFVNAAENNTALEILVSDGMKQKFRFLNRLTSEEAYDLYVQSKMEASEPFFDKDIDMDYPQLETMRMLFKKGVINFEEFS